MREKHNKINLFHSSGSNAIHHLYVQGISFTYLGYQTVQLHDKAFINPVTLLVRCK